MLLAFILVAIVTVLLCWLLFVLASLALPLLVATIVGQAVWHAGFGLLTSLLSGLAAGAITLFAGQLMVTMLRGSASRSGVVVLFAVPAAVAGYSAAQGLATIAGASPVWQAVLSIGAGMCVAGSAVMRLAAGIPDAMPDAGRRGDMSASPS